MNEIETSDVKTRAILAYLWSSAAIVFLGYILYMWGSRVEILTLIIGLISGTILGGIFGVYFAGATAKKSDVNAGSVQGDVNIGAPDSSTVVK